ncbi:hypothetical protein BX070DRAFT_230087 [Coemansia spiralis]|nr:hypothetical protein BX070DRAFT_230087 [Coemansia spiralis]
MTLWRSMPVAKQGTTRRTIKCAYWPAQLPVCARVALLLCSSRSGHFYLFLCLGRQQRYFRSLVRKEDFHTALASPAALQDWRYRSSSASTTKVQALHTAAGVNGMEQSEARLTRIQNNAEFRGFFFRGVSFCAQQNCSSLLCAFAINSICNAISTQSAKIPPSLPIFPRCFCCFRRLCCRDLLLPLSHKTTKTNPDHHCIADKPGKKRIFQILRLPSHWLPCF